MEDFVTYDQAYQLKQLGFDYECNHFYCQPKGKELKRICYIPNDFLDPLYHDFNNPSTWSDNSAETFSAPTLSQVQKWLRETKGIHLWIKPEPNEPLEEMWYIFYVLDENRLIYPVIECEKCYTTYEEAFLDAINKSLELIQGQNNGNKIN